MRAFLLTTILALTFVLSETAWARPQQPQAGEESDTILNFPGSVPLDALVKSVSTQLEIKILYDDKLATKKINVRATGAVPQSSLLGVLQSSLRMNGLALVHADVPGWMKIVEVSQFAQTARPLGFDQTGMTESGNTPVTEAIKLDYADASKLATEIKPFLTSGQGQQNSSNVLALKNQKVLIVTDYASNVVRLRRLIKIMDQPAMDVTTRFVKAKHLDAATLASNLGQLLAARKKAKGVSEESTAEGIEVTFDSRTNQIILVGESSLVEQAEEYLATLDVEIDTRTEVYTPSNIAAAKVENLIKGMIEVRGTRPVFRSVVDDEQNLFVATTTDAIHKEIRDLMDRLDLGPESSQRNSPVRFYRLKHATAEDVLRTIKELEGTVRESSIESPVANRRNGRFSLQQQGNPTGVNRPDVQLPPEVRDASGQLPLGMTDAQARLANQFNAADSIGTDPSLDLLGMQSQISLTDAIGRARLTADPGANTLIVIATPEVHQVYRELIEKLDQPRPQVLVEARLVVVDTSDDFTLGVEISGGDRSGANRLFAFSQFGFSEVDAVNGALSIIPGLGFNGTLVDADVADVVLRAVTTHRRSKVISSPRILVNDNATGYLTSVTEVPFNSFNTFNTVSSTSFAGYAEAGTTITVTPHISEGDQLQLEYSITLNAFSAEGGSDSSPPPRQTDEIESTVTIPDGHTIIVGGLTRTNHSTANESIPFLEQIPVIKHLVSNNTDRWSRSSLFIFLKPVILRDDKFRDLKYLSRRDTRDSRTKGTFPFSEPLLVR